MPLLTRQKRQVHFIGVGGIGMSGLAEILLNLGYTVTGSDLTKSDITRRLEELGLVFYEGHEAGQVGEAAITVISAAVDEDNVELREARDRGIPVLHRSEVLADLIRLKPHAVVVGGSHGKTTTTSMISAILDRADIGATSIVGGILHRSGTNAKWGTGDYIVAEADEHDGSFLRLHPSIAVVTNIDEEHMEYYGTIDGIKRAFTDFCNGVPFYGCSILCGDDLHTSEILSDLDCLTLTYGLTEGSSLRAMNIRVEEGDGSGSRSDRIDNLRTCFEVESLEERLGGAGSLGTLSIRALGANNVRNALASCAVGLCLGLPFETIISGLADFEGVQRRMQVQGEERGIVVIEDYAHHPTELASTLDAVKCASPGRVIAVFQPHLYSRTKFFSEAFAEILVEFDLVLLTDIYPSREEPMPGVDSGLILDAAHRHGHHHVELVNDMFAVPEVLAPQLKEGDVVLVLGAGNINRIVSPLLEQIRQG